MLFYIYIKQYKKVYFKLSKCLKTSVKINVVGNEKNLTIFQKLLKTQKDNTYDRYLQQIILHFFIIQLLSVYRINMEKLSVGKDLKFECIECFARLTYQNQPHNCPEGEEDKGFICDLELYNADITGTNEVKVDEGFFDLAKS